MKPVLVVRHVSCETLGTIADALSQKGIPTREVLTFKEPVPERIDDAAGLILMGGPMGVYEGDRFPFLRQEMRLIERALREKKPVLGVCLGSQLLAAALGGQVTRGRRKEIGWHSVALTAPAADDPLWTGIGSPFTAYHWHGDIFELPQGAVSLASSDLTACQGFRYGPNAYGFLFHMEVTKQIIEDMVKTFAPVLDSEKIDGREILRGIRDYLPALQTIGKVVFGRWAGLVGG